MTRTIRISGPFRRSAGTRPTGRSRPQAPPSWRSSIPASTRRIQTSRQHRRRHVLRGRLLVVLRPERSRHVHGGDHRRRDEQRQRCGRRRLCGRLRHARHGPWRRRPRPGQRHHRGRRLGRRSRRRRHPHGLLGHRLFVCPPGGRGLRVVSRRGPCCRCRQRRLLDTRVPRRRSRRHRRLVHDLIRHAGLLVQLRRGGLPRRAGRRHRHGRRFDLGHVGRGSPRRWCRCARRRE